MLRGDEFVSFWGPSPGETLRRPCVWVLREHLGRNEAARVLEAELARRGDGPERPRIEAAIRLLAEDPILRYR